MMLYADYTLVLKTIYFNARFVFANSFPTTTPTDISRVKLPKLDIPTFNGDLLNWKQFWEQFCVAVHNRTSISNAEKLAYLRNALKDGTAKSAIEGLSKTGEHYVEAVECLKNRYDRPRLIHQTHVKCILDSPPLKEGSGRELRRLHDTVQQHIRALKVLGHEPSGPFITSVIELKLDTNTMFEWQKYSHDEGDVPHYNQLLMFIDHRAQASEASLPPQKKHEPSYKKPVPRTAHSYTANTEVGNTCICCKAEKHPLYICQGFKALFHDRKLSFLKSNNICNNCLTKGHSLKNCKCIHKCKICQSPHHTLLHIASTMNEPVSTPVSSNMAVKLKTECLLMTCRALLTAPSGYSIEARCLLDNASSASFVSERVAQLLSLPRSFQSLSISGITGSTNGSNSNSVTQLAVSPIGNLNVSFPISAIIVPRVTCELPTHPIPFKLEWEHLFNLSLADPDFGLPGRIDVLGIDVYINALLQGQLTGPPGSPVAFETIIGWVLGGNISCLSPSFHVMSHCTSISSLDDTIRKFWEIEEAPATCNDSELSLEERTVVRHFQETHSRSPEGRFIISLPKKPGVPPLGESRSQAVRRFLSLERSLYGRGLFREVNEIMLEYLSLGHAEDVPLRCLQATINCLLPAYACSV